MRIPQTSAVVAAIVLLATTLTACADSPEPSGARPARTATGNGLVAEPATYAGGTSTGSRAAPPTCVAKGSVDVCFSSPADHGGNDPTVVAHIRRLFESAGAGDSLRIAMFRWDIASPAQALIDAQKRGAHVEIVADRDVVTNPVGKNLVAEIESNDPSKRNVIICKGACLPWRGRGPAPPSQDVNHLKLILAEIGGEKSVATTSLNLEGRQYAQANSMLRMIDPSVYKYSLQYFKRLRAQSNLKWDDGDKMRPGKGKTPDVAVYPSRKDLLISTLNQVRCAKGMNTIDVMHAVIQRYDVRAALGRLQRSGCKVRIVVTRELIENWLQAPVTLSDGSRFDIPNDQVKTLLTHDKVYAIHARFKGKESYLVVTGTSNATCGGLLYNDEMMARLQGRWVWKQYTQHVSIAFGNAHQSPNPGTLPVQAHCG